MLFYNLIDAIKFPFRKEKELYRAFRYMIGFYPRDISLYKEALLHKSMSLKAKSGKPVNNERLEFLGDAVLDALIGEIVYRKFQGKNEGFLTNTRSKIVQRETLGKLAEEIGLDKLVKSNSHSQGHNSYLAGNTFEAMIGAIYMDRGYTFCQKFMNEKVIGKLINLDEMAQKEVNFKSKLLEWSQKHKVMFELELVDQDTNEEGAPIFKSRVRLNGRDCGMGKGYSKKESHQIACKNALHRLKHDGLLHRELLAASLPVSVG